jgi:hypothetical protein
MNSAAHPVKAGFNQSGGAYFMITQPLTLTGAGVATAATTYIPTGVMSHMHVLTSAGSNSGGAFVGPTLAVANARDAFGIATADTAGIAGALVEVGQGKLLRDMGKTVVSSGRTFRKFAAAGTGSVKYASSFGVTGGPAVAPNGGYANFYLEVCREGQGVAVPAPVARYF